MKKIMYCHSEAALKLATAMGLSLYRLHSSKLHETTYSIEHGAVMKLNHKHGFYIEDMNGKPAIAVVNGNELYRLCNHGDKHCMFDVFTRAEVLDMATEYLTLGKRGFIIHNKIKK